jgi:hypothetical protein
MIVVYVECSVICAFSYSLSEGPLCCGTLVSQETSTLRNACKGRLYVHTCLIHEVFANLKKLYICYFLIF